MSYGYEPATLASPLYHVFKVCHHQSLLVVFESSIYLSNYPVNRSDKNILEELIDMMTEIIIGVVLIAGIIAAIVFLPKGKKKE